MNELQLPVSALFFSLLLFIVFFSKQRLKLIENKLYSIMIIMGLVDSIIIIIERLLVISGDINLVTPLVISILNVTNKIDFGVLIILTTCAFLYTLLITYPQSKKKIKNWIKLTVIFDLLVYLVIICLDLELISQNNIISVSGSSILVTYLLCGIYLIASIIMAILNIKKLTVRHIPIISVIFIFAFLMLIFDRNPYIMVISITIAFVNYLMYFTIENPDIKMIEALSKSKDMAEKYNKDKSIFIFNMTQQIRYPLNVMDQKIELMLEEDNIDKLKEQIIDIRMLEKRISTIVNGALDVTTMDAKKIKLVNNKYKFKNLLTEISIRAEQEANKKNLDFRTNFDSAMPEMLYGDSIRIKQIINALISNSIKYTEKGFVELSVNTIISFDVCRLIIMIKDSGTGIKTEEINKLFAKKDKEELELKDVDVKEITLDVVKKMVNLIGGTITVESEKNKGSEFTLIIDQKIANEENKIMNIIEKYDKENAKKNILFVSDDEAERNLYNKKLTNAFLVTFANNGQDCLQRIRKEEQYDLIIIRENMDKLSGVVVIDKLRHLKDFNIPIVILTENKDSKETLLKKGYDNIITKDMTQSQLLKFLSKYND